MEERIRSEGLKFLKIKKIETKITDRIIATNK
jgi:hypothetical protein